jgi:hypothetical protein
MSNVTTYGKIGLCGIVLSVLTSTLIGFSLDDWDFFGRFSVCVSMSDPMMPLITRIAMSNKYLLYLPCVILTFLLWHGRRKPSYHALILSMSTILAVMIFGYIAAYLPFAKPDYWFNRPWWMLPKTEMER